jgi:hypothetical protein
MKRVILGVMLAMFGALTMHVSAAEKTITGAELEAMIAQDPELNPCRIVQPAGTTVINPVAFYIETQNGQVTDGIVNQVSVEIRIEGMEERQEHFTVPLTEALGVSGYPNCYRIAYTPGPSLARNGTTRYVGQSRLSHTSNPAIFGPWVSADAPFVLKSSATTEILAHKMRFGNQ